LRDFFAVAFGGLLAAFLEVFPETFLETFLGESLAVFAADFFDVFDEARVAFPERDLGDFLRVFLDIRLPFVAFAGSTNGVLRPLPRHAGIKPTAGQV
jgi:hypothetical protein